MRMLLVPAALALAACPPLHASRVPTSCGPGERVVLGACIAESREAVRCERGRARDVEGDRCLSVRDVRALAQKNGVFVADDDVVICTSDADELVARSGRVACVARASSPSACPTGTIREGSACAPVVSRGIVDLARFARAAAAFVCDEAARQPSLGGASEERFELALTIRAPDNDATQASATVRTVPPLADVDLEPAAEVAVDALRRLGMTTSTSVLTAELRCSRAWRRPKSAGN